MIVGSGLEHGFEGKAKFATFTHQQWVKWVSNNKKEIWQDWLDYVNNAMSCDIVSTHTLPQE